MINDIENELDVIQNTLVGEDVRDAIVSAFRKLKTSGIGVLLTTEEWEDLTDLERDNGNIYFVSDMNIIDGDNYYFNDDVSNDKVLISYEIGKKLVDSLKTKYNITGNMSLAQLPALIDMGTDTFHPLVSTSYEGGSYISTTGDWVYSTNLGDYIIDVYSLEANTNYVVLLGDEVSNVLRVATYTVNPINQASSIISTSQRTLITAKPSPGSWSIVTFTSNSSQLYLGVMTSTEAKDNVDVYVFPVSALSTIISSWEALNG